MTPWVIITHYYPRPQSSIGIRFGKGSVNTRGDINDTELPSINPYYYRDVVIPAHVELGDGDCDVVHRESSLKEEILAHVSEGGGGVNSVAADSVPLKIWRSVSTLEIVLDVTKIFTEIFPWMEININPVHQVRGHTEMHIKCVNNTFSLLAGTLDCSASVLQGEKKQKPNF